MSEPKTREELAREGMELVRWQATRMGKLPAGMSAEDLESSGGEAVLESLAVYDAASGLAFKSFCRATVRSRMRDAIRAWRRHADRTVSLSGAGAGGRPAPVPADKKAGDPAAVAEAKDRPGRRAATRLKDAEGTFPSPELVAERVVALRGAMFGAISSSDIGDVMRAVMDRAKGGDLKAAQVLIGLLAPATSGVRVETVVALTEARE